MERYLPLLAALVIASPSMAQETNWAGMIAQEMAATSFTSGRLCLEESVDGKQRVYQNCSGPRIQVHSVFLDVNSQVWRVDYINKEPFTLGVEDQLEIQPIAMPQESMPKITDFGIDGLRAGDYMGGKKIAELPTGWVELRNYNLELKVVNYHGFRCGSTRGVTRLVA